MTALEAARAAAGVLALSGCQNNPYVIGRFTDDACAAHGSAIACSGFERPDLSDFTTTVVEDAGEVEQTGTKAHHGQGALRARTTAEESAAVVALEFTPHYSGDLYLRTYLFVASGIQTQTTNFLFLGDYATPDPFKGVDFNLENGAPQVFVPGSQPDRITSTTLTIPRDRWFCFQAQITLSATAGAVKILVDGAPALDQAGLDTLPPAGVHLLRAGVDWSSLQKAPFEVFMDDLVLDTSPIACD
jgi:hypothetical protein